MEPVYFDIETAPRPSEEIQKFKPGFEPDSRLKDPEKIAADLAQKEAKWIEKGALDAITGAILAIGIMDEDGPKILHMSDMVESEMITKFWDLFKKRGASEFIGHNCKAFDVPFLMRRSFMLGVRVPFEAMEGRYLSRRFKDTMEMWACGTKDMVKLKMICKALDVGEKDGDGKDFAPLYLNPETREKALEYLVNDLKLTKACAEKMRF